jgi:glycosyltransferase involved in cell wall biosynthesis
MAAAVIPARNESARLPGVLDRLAQLGDPGFDLTTFVVDDASSDGTRELAETRGCRVLRMETNVGKGAAARAGCDLAEASGAGVIVLLDADGQHRPEDIPRMVAPIIDGRADVVHGVRRFGSDMPMLFRVGNLVLNLCHFVLFGQWTRDSQCGMQAFSVSSYPKLRWASTDYAMESEILVRTARARLRRTDVEIPTIYLDAAKGTRPSDGLRILTQMLRWRIALPPTPSST